MKAIVTIDVDTLKDYANAYGFDYNTLQDPVYKLALPRLVKIFDKYNIKATFFIVGRDLENKNHLIVLKSLIASGHEIANHTQNHYHEFNKLPVVLQRKEIINCHTNVKRLLKIDMKGFRAPGYNLSKSTYRTLSSLNYTYDSSVFPTILLPLLKLAMILTAKGRQKSTGGGNFKNIFQKDSPFFIKSHKLLEIPITVTPILRLPFMGTFNIIAPKLLYDFNYLTIKLSGKIINYEIHPIELLNFKKDNLPDEFKVHPGINKPLKAKLIFYENFLKNLSRHYQIITMSEFSESFLN